MGRRRAFTLTEVIVATVIVGLLSALLFPVFAKVKDRANEAHCVSNFRQIHLALSAYRTAWDGIDSPAPGEQMGFPPTIFHAVLTDLEVRKAYTSGILKCRGKGYTSAHPPAYGEGWGQIKGTPLWSQEDEDDWIRHVTVMGQGAIVYIDPSHQLYPPSRLSIQRALGLDLAGSAKWRQKRGPYHKRTWWEG
ncbi:MAG: type II secretion system protein [Fimbriimonadaceae bacterium]